MQSTLHSWEVRHMYFELAHKSTTRVILCKKKSQIHLCASVMTKLCIKDVLKYRYKVPYAFRTQNQDEDIRMVEQKMSKFVRILLKMSEIWSVYSQKNH